MTASKTIATYSDCQTIMDKALKAKGGRVRFETPSQAVRFRYRCYVFRKMLRPVNVPKALATTVYDDLYLTIEDSTVVFNLYSLKPLPDFEGNEAVTEDDEILSAAQHFRPGDLSDL